MLIDQPQLAAATIETDGTPHKFDEIGDMFQFHVEHPTKQVRAWFVHDYQTEAWLRAESAFFVYRPELPTPMGHGLVAFETQASAEAFATEYNRTSKAYGRTAVTSKNDAKPKKALD